MAGRYKLAASVLKTESRDKREVGAIPTPSASRACMKDHRFALQANFRGALPLRSTISVVSAVRQYGQGLARPLQYKADFQV
jgi:hypothetical protein